MHSSEYAWLGLHTSQKCLNVPQYAFMPLNMLEHGWILLNVPEYVWKCLNTLFWLCQVLNMLQYSYNNNVIIIVNNVIILKFLSARFVHPGAVLPFYLFQHELEQKLAKANELLRNFSFRLFKGTAECIFECKTTFLR